MLHGLTLMYVSEHMVLWPHSLLYGMQQLLTAGPVASRAEVPVPQGGPVGHQDVYTCRGNQFPLLLTRLPSLQVEGPPTKFRLPVRRRSFTEGGRPRPNLRQDTSSTGLLLINPATLGTYQSVQIRGVASFQGCICTIQWTPVYSGLRPPLGPVRAD